MRGSESQIVLIKLSDFFCFCDEPNMSSFPNRKHSDSNIMKSHPMFAHLRSCVLLLNMQMVQMYNSWLHLFSFISLLTWSYDMNINLSWISSFSCGGKCLVGRNLSGQTDVSVQYWLLYFSLCLCSCVGIMWLLPRHGSDWLPVWAQLTVRIILRPCWWFWDLIEDRTGFQEELFMHRGQMGTVV